MTAPQDRARAMVLVEVEPALAFELFTAEIDRWWRRGLRYRVGGAGGIIALEPRVGGELYERFDTPAGPKLVVTGTVTVWEPPRRLCFEWRGVNFAPGERTLVEVEFVPSARGTQVCVTHGGWAALRPDHPVRHGRPPAAFLAEMGLWWGGLLTSLREHAAGR